MEKTDNSLNSEQPNYLSKIKNELSHFSKKRAEEQQSSRTEAINTFGTESIKALTGKEIQILLHILRHGNTIGIWETPTEWIPSHLPTFLRIDIKARIIDFLPKDSAGYTKPSSKDYLFFCKIINQAVLQTTRYLILCRIGPAGMRSSPRKPLDVTSIASIAYLYIPRIAAAAVHKTLLSHHDLSEMKLFSKFGLDEFFNVEERHKAIICREIKRMQYFYTCNLWEDAPSFEILNKNTSIKGSASPSVSQETRDSYKPLPDDFVSELGWKSNWIIENIGPNIISHLNKLEPFFVNLKAKHVSTSTLAKYKRLEISQFKWIDSKGNNLVNIPFPIQLRELGLHFRKSDKSNQVKAEIEWPPTILCQIWGLAALVQTAHMIVTLLAMAPRASEHLSLERDCVSYAKDGNRYANGRTYKLVEPYSGVMRDWVLPDFAAQCIEQQTRLIAAADKLDSVGKNHIPGQYLWGRIVARSSKRTAPLNVTGLNDALKSFAKTLKMPTNPGGQNLTSHRFRKTIARLAALAIVEAPKILMDVFGHKSINMTLYYILQDEDLQGDIETIARELRIMRAKAVVEDMVAAEEASDQIQSSNENYVDLGGFGGPKAIRIHAAVKSSREAVHKTGATWGANNVYELAELLTMQGTTWQLVRPGVVCTKAIGEVGPCNKKKGHPEPSRCQVECSSRLEEAWLQEDVDECIAEALEHYVESGKNGSDLVQSFWANQVLGNLPRFPALQRKWRQHDVVQLILQNAAPT